jgi:hypothetical protein
MNFRAPCAASHDPTREGVVRRDVPSDVSLHGSTFARGPGIRTDNVGLLQPLFLHFLSQAQWTHVCPYFFNVGQALFFCAALPCIFPA